MTKTKIESELASVRGRLTKCREKYRAEESELMSREKRLMEEWKEADDAEKFRIVKRLKITPEQLMQLNEISEAEMERILSKKQREEGKADEAIV